MDSNFYFYYGMAQQWLIANGAKKKHDKDTDVDKKEPIKIRYFDDLPKGVW